MIELKNITKTFRKKNRDFTALADVSLSVEKGKIFGVIGASGAGKSTLIRCVNLLEKPTSGMVVVDGQDMLSLSAGQLAEARRQIGMIFQHFNLLSSRTVFDNIALPLELSNTPKAEINKRVTDLLTLVGLQDKQHDYPSSLSGGQKQRVAIARTLANNPKVLLCDEATSALDPETTGSILKLLKDINRRMDITILLITHEMHVVKSICDEVAVISNGKLIEQGTVADIFSHPKTDLTKNFIASALDIELPEDFKERLTDAPAPGKHPLLKLEFSGHSVNDPVLSETARVFGIDCNIISARMEYAGSVKFGVMLIEVYSNTDDVEKVITFFESKLIKTQILGYV
ncbi:D-methionine ABC transporter, ATP-binding protein [Mucilaginibacter limnophilus]|uniref:D-methionine ABC transporter, ATP-binding protein n=1 Tax=Mucilaginibacter limnophilus TaxID=1932778 RepID=A0A3S2V499_9SPHI|nr:methionine ABC transporter ATP-binding protein MetN [Mucilaginibacter limnophilus]RVU03039.1 D-methionine ABC transporter, ATP-binding protein [Mucilaginibacter limnophilus]